MNSHMIRKAKFEDIPELVTLCQEHAAFEQAEYSTSGKSDKLREHIFGDPQGCFCLVVEIDQALAGYATYSKEFSTWDAGFYIHMDCLFLRPAMRGRGIGRELMDRIVLEARELGCLQIQWQTPKFNTRAIEFYKRLGASGKEKMRFYLNVEKEKK
jgi:GNAT superfamily N-acetyltransferase